MTREEIIKRLEDIYSDPDRRHGVYVNKLHVELFGVEPVFTGYYYECEKGALERMIESMLDGKPFVEPELEDGEFT